MTVSPHCAAIACSRVSLDRARRWSSGGGDLASVARHPRSAGDGPRDAAAGRRRASTGSAPTCSARTSTHGSSTARALRCPRASPAWRWRSRSAFRSGSPPAGSAAGSTPSTMRISDTFLAFPPMLLPITLIAMLGPGLDHVVVAIALSWFPWYARILRVAVETVKNEPYVEAARRWGIHPLRIAARHVLPNSLTALVVQATVDLGNVIQWAVALELHRAGSGRAHARVGPRARRRLGVVPLLLVDGDVPRRRDRGHGAGAEPGGRRPARRARPKRRRVAAALPEDQHEGGHFLLFISFVLAVRARSGSGGNRGRR